MRPYPMHSLTVFLSACMFPRTFFAADIPPPATTLSTSVDVPPMPMWSDTLGALWTSPIPIVALILLSGVLAISYQRARIASRRNHYPGHSSQIATIDYYARIMLVGDGSTGKTTFVNALMMEDTREAEKTIDKEVRTYQMRHEKIVQDAAKPLHAESLWIDVEDVRGQAYGDLIHARTHPITAVIFFLDLFPGQEFPTPATYNVDAFRASVSRFSLQFVQMVEGAARSNPVVILFVNKVDQHPSPHDLLYQMDILAPALEPIRNAFQRECHVVFGSAREGTGIPSVLRRIRKHAIAKTGG